MTDNYTSYTKPIHQQGFTLIELMISIVLGLLVIAAATAIFLSGQRSLNVQTGMSELQQNSIFGLSQIAHDLRHLNLNTTGDQKITKDAAGAGVVFSSTNLVGLPSNMGTVQGLNRTNMNVASDQLTIQYRPSITGLVNCEGDELNNSDVVNVQRYYVQAVPNSNPARYNLMCDAWYPAKAGSALNKGAVIILQDVEAFRVRFGVKVGQGVQYKSPNAVGVTEPIIAVEVGLVTRSNSSVGSNNHINVPKDSGSAFVIAGTPVWLSSADGQDRFLREAFSQVVAIRNGQGGI